MTNGGCSVRRVAVQWIRRLTHHLAFADLGIALGYLSAIIPARRATRAEVLDAIQST